MIQSFRENRRLQGFLLILPTLLVMFVMLIIPLTLTVITSFGQRDTDGNVIYTFTLENYWRLIGFTEDGWDDLYLGILLRSLWLAVQTTVIVILMAYPLAYFIARAPEKRRNFLLFLVLIPLWTNFIIRIYAWVMILRGQGVLNSALGGVAGLLSIPFQPLDLYPSQTAVLIGMVYEFLPFMILPIYTSLEKIEPNLYEAAADLYANAFRTFWRVTVPLSMPGVIAGAMLVFIPAIGEFVIPSLLGGPGTQMIGRILWDEFFAKTNWPRAAALAVTLLVIVVIPFMLMQRAQDAVVAGR